MFFDGWDDLWRLLVVGLGGYAGLVLVLRLTGKRTLSKMNAFDLVITVAFGSTLAAVLTSQSVSLSEGLLAFTLLCLLQFAVAFFSSRFSWFEQMVKAQPALLYFKGRFLDAALKKERVSREEVVAAVRGQGAADMGEIDAVVLETDGSFSVISGAHSEHAGTLAAVIRHED